MWRPPASVRLLIVFSGLAARAAVLPADSERGERLFETLSCVQCHKIYGKGGTAAAGVGAPDLGRTVDRNFSPAVLAATLWNHAPGMWAAMRDRGISAGDLDEQAASDLFAYFYAARFFERPGDAGRGKRLFSDKQCAVCHGLTEAKIPEAKPVAQWEALGQPISLINALWNHAANMRQEFARRKVAWPQLAAQDLSDMLVYLRNLPAARGIPARLEITSGANGAALFKSKGCLDCHTGRLTLAPRLKGKTLTDIAVDMWNHASHMAATPARLDVSEMRELTSYLWADQFFEDTGSLTAGRRVFTAKQCVVCHSDPSSGAPHLPKPRQSFTGAAMVSALWHHGPRMQEQMKAKHVPWPRFEGTEMADLIAYLGSSRTGN
jgi:cytochrome c2